MSLNLIVYGLLIVFTGIVWWTILERDDDETD